MQSPTRLKPRKRRRVLALSGASVLVTGGTGSFGQEMVRLALKQGAKRVVVFSRDEQKQYRMAQELNGPALRYFIGDVRDRDRLQMAMDGIDVVIHAAAMKHVPTAEYNPFECIRTNIWGAENIVISALGVGARRVVCLSTDKAVAPVNLYGATKLAADKCFVAGNNLSGTSRTRFSVVRYGNVVGSRGSAVELFQRLVAQGAYTLPITDKSMTRFWITKKRAAQFVLECLTDMKGGEIFVPKIPSMRIDDLAKVIGPNCTLKEVGIRPGEKLHETLIPADEARNTREFRDRYIIYPAFSWWESDDEEKKYIFHHEERAIYREEGKPVKDGFTYTSDGNPWMLNKEDLRRLI